MGGKNNAPKPPDMTQIADAQVESAKIWADVASSQLEWAKTTDAENRQLLERVLAVQIPQLEAAYEQALADRARYEEVYQPLEDNLVKEFQEYDTPERREQKAAERIADVRAQYDAQRRNAAQNLEDYGFDPTETKYQALDLGFRASEAANAALAANQGRESVEQMGRALRAEGINIGRGYPSQVAQSQGIVNQTAGGAIQNSQSTMAGTVAANQGALGAGQLAGSYYNDAGNTLNSGYQNQLAQYNANAANSGALWGGIGALAGSAVGGPFGGM